MTTKQRPSEAIFADGRKRARPLALHPDAIGVSYPTREVRDRKTYELRAMVTSDVAEVSGGVAVLSIDGPLEHKGGDSWWSFWQNYEDLARDFKLILDDSAIEAVVLKFDSPGGEVSGLNETVALMKGMKLASGKPVVAYVDEACYSAAYALAMVADEIYLPESAGVGSIGVITAMADCTEADKKAGVRIEVIASGEKKTDGHPHVALTEGAIKRTKKLVDKLASEFFDLVSEGRGLSVEAVAGFQAGIYTGQDAVDVGLADGVMSLAECLTLATNVYSPTKAPTDRLVETKEAPMTGTLGATKALNDAHKAMAAAKTDAERALAAARILAAEGTVAKVKKTKVVTTDTHEEETDDGEPEDDDEDEDEDKDEDAEKAEDAEESEKAAVSVGSVVALARRITGKRSIEEVMGALQGMADSHKKTSALAAKVAQLEADAQAGKVSALIATGLKAGKLAPSQRAWAKTQSPASLKAYLDAAPKMVHTVDEEHVEAKVEKTVHGTVTAEMAKIWKKLGHAEKDYPALLAKMNGTATPTNGAS